MRFKTHEEMKEEYGAETLFEAMNLHPITTSVEDDKRILMYTYHSILRYRQPTKRVTKKRISLKYRFKDVPTDAMVPYELLERFDRIHLMRFKRNAGWYAVIINKCKVIYAFS